MVYFGQLRPGTCAEDLRVEYDLSPDSYRHVAWLCQSGMLNRDDIRTMLTRAQTHGNAVRYGIAMTEAAPSPPDLGCSYPLAQGPWQHPSGKAGTSG